MKPTLLKTLFRATALLCKATGAVDRAAQRLHLKARNRCTAENLASCNTRQPARERFV